MQTLHISHNDLDGLGCGVLIKKFLPGPVTTAYLGYDDIDAFIEDNLHRYDNVIITDVSPSYNSVEMLAGETDTVIIDHHASSEKLKDFHFTVHDISVCATLLTYRWLQKQGYDVTPYEEFALCVNDVDMWHLKRSDSLKMSVLFNLMGLDRMEKRFLNEPYNGFSQTEELLISLEEERREAYINKAMRNMLTFKDKHGQTFCAVFAESYSSELGNRIIQDGTADYVMLISAQTKRVSLRSRKEVDIRLIAEANGGGGHKNAAGFPIKGESFDLEGLLLRAGITGK